MQFGPFDQPFAFVRSDEGRLACLDEEGTVLWLDERHELPAPAMALAFHGEDLAILADDALWRWGAKGTIPVPPGARAIAFTMGGGLLLGCPRQLFRLGDHPLELTLPEDFDLRALAVDTGGFWVGGATEVIGYRPVPGGVAERRRIPVSAPVRAMAPGPDGRLYLLLEPGREVYCETEHRGTATRDLFGMVREGPRLVGLADEGLAELSRFVGDAPDAPDIEIPNCDG
ncbi:MAG: hypothetical protein AAGD14_18495 [Planctomycetota bacterium]